MSRGNKYQTNSKEVQRKRKEKEFRERQEKHYVKNYVGSPTLTEWVYPIYACQKQSDKIITRKINGTAFSIGGDLLMTANHVVLTDDNYNHLQIGFLNQVASGFVSRYDFEVVDRFVSSDIAIIKCEGISAPAKKPKPFHWTHHGLNYYQTIRAMGYPGGYDPVRNFTTARAFQGTRIGSRDFKHDDIDARCYELSFHCLRGLSGTCLLDENYKINGVVIGNSKDEANIFTEKEEIDTGENKIIREYIKDEVTYIGLAVDRQHIFGLHSEYLNKTIHDYLIESKLHICYC